MRQKKWKRKSKIFRSNVKRIVQSGKNKERGKIKTNFNKLKVNRLVCFLKKKYFALELHALMINFNICSNDRFQYMPLNKRPIGCF